jgi:Caspase domain
MKQLTVAIAAILFCLLAVAAPEEQDIRDIRSRLLAEKLPQASAEIGPDGRVRLTGQYKDRAEVQIAFSVAQQVAGVKWVAPTTPENIRYPGTEGMRQGMLDALRKSKKTNTGSTPRVAVNHALVVGVGIQYQNRDIPPIPNAGDDAKAFHNFLSARGFRRENLKLLIENEATKENVFKALKDLEQQVQDADTVVLYFSSHGTKPNDLGNTGIILYDTEIIKNKGWWNTKTVVQDDDIKRFIETVSPARVMVVLDVCYSGGAFAKIPGFLAVSSSSKDLFVEESEFATGFSQKNLTYLAGSQAAQEKILIAASGPGEKSWNSGELKNGYFTYYFLQELNGKGDVQRAFESAKPIVRNEVRQKVSAEQGKEINQTPQATFIPSAANFKFTGR